MTYQEVLDWMFAQLPMYQNQGISAYKADLSNTEWLMKHLNHPHRDLKCIHIGGTNGKGSTASLMASVLQETGYKVGLYTSPHLKDYRERIKINGQPIPEDDVVNFISTNINFFETHQLSFFEMTVGLAFDYFKKEKVDYAVIEVGLGGRLDSTNIINPLLSVITNVGWDHMNILGDSLEKIAFEKAGIIKLNTPIVIGEYLTESKNIYLEKAKLNHAPIYFASEEINQTPACALLGEYQKHNKKTVVKAVEVLNDLGLNISNKNIADGFNHVIQNTDLKGRWQILQDKPKTVTDIAHNYDGLKIVLSQISNENYENLHFVLGFSNDKDLSKILPLFPQKASYYFSKPNVPRGLEAHQLQSEALKYGLNGKTFSNIEKALEEAKSKALPDDFIYIGGSAFVVAEII
jgi:dihydrofolate synthase / folylpolyglutamate synthase